MNTGEVAEPLGLGVWELDLVTGDVTVDAHVARVWGLEPGTTVVPVVSWLRRVHPDDRAPAREMAERMAATGELPEFGYRYERRDGEWIHVVTRGIVAEHEHGAPRRVRGVLLDVSETQRAARDVLETLEHLSEGYYSLDDEWRFTFVNRRAEEIFGVPREKLLGRTAGSVFGPTEADHFHAVFQRAVETGEPWESVIHFGPWDRWFEIRVLPSSSGGLSVSFDDCTERQRAQRSDPLTGLADRIAVEEWLAAALAKERPAVALFLLDLDRFKWVNESLGHGIGDALLREIGRRVEAVADGEPFDGVVARSSGDEFVLAGVLPDADAGRRMVRALLETVRQPIDVEGRSFVMTTSIGIAHTGVEREMTAASMLRDAEAALYRAKAAGGDRATSFDQRLHQRAVRRIELEAELRRALEGDELRVVYQPSFDLATGMCTGAEALVRWHHPDRGVVAPGEFIPLAEETGLIVPLGRRVLDLVARHLGSRPPDPGDPPFTVWVNASAKQFADPAFFSALAEEPLFLAGRLGLEVTETMLLEEPVSATAALRELADAGLKVAIDDFGTGYSSLGRLPRYPFDLLKIDQSFVRGMDEAPFRAIVAATIQLGHGLQKRVIAEGVERRGELVALRRLGCDEVSGFLLARPVPPAELVDAIRRGIAQLAGDGGGEAAS